jgi:hypothetical protein
MADKTQINRSRIFSSKRGSQAKQDLAFQSAGLQLNFTSLQYLSDKLCEQLIETEDITYCLDVVVPELFIFICMEITGYTHKAAEKFLLTKHQV